MTILEFIKKLGINPNEEVEDTSKEALESNKVNNKDKSDDSLNNTNKEDEADSKVEDTKNNKTDTTVEDEETDGSVKDTKDNKDTVNKEDNNGGVKMAVLPKYDASTGLFDTTGVEDAELVSLLTSVNENVINVKNSALISKAVDDKINSVKLNKGITADAVKTLINLSEVKVGKDGKVHGLDKAFNELQTSQSGLFNTNKETNSPLLEGFNPARDAGNANYVPNSFVEAFSMQEN